MDEGFNLFMKNPYWKALYENAPTDLMKKYIRYDFNNNLSPVVKKRPNDFMKKVRSMENQFTEIEWQYLIDNTSSGIAKSQYQKRLAELKKQ